MMYHIDMVNVATGASYEGSVRDNPEQAVELVLLMLKRHRTMFEAGGYEIRISIV